MRKIMPMFLLALAVACGKEEGPTAKDELEALAEQDAPCTTSADCCAVVDSCHAITYVVRKEDQPRAAELVSELRERTCGRCVTPQSFTLACIEGSCAAVRMLEMGEDGEIQHGSRCGGTDEVTLETDMTLERILGCSG